MTPLAGNPIKSNQTYIQREYSSREPAEKGMTQADSELVFRLIDSILPFEACLYHQVLPLSLEGTRLNLGMVNPDDRAALDYVRRILAYMNCSLVPLPITAANHQATLSAYLNHTGQAKQAAAATGKTTSSHKIDLQNQATLIVDSPAELSQPPERTERTERTTSSHQTTSAKARTQPDAKKTDAINRTPIGQSQPKPPKPPNTHSLPVLEVKAKYVSSPVEVLAKLPPKELLDELLARVLAGGIGRLYFERHPDRGRILWSQNGVLQSVLEGLDTSVFQGVINELKRLTHLSLISVEQPKQVEIERIYQNHRLLLRLRVMPATHGEEATLQVLRGAALKFYQQQQLENLSRDALGIAQQLQTKINEIQKRTRIDPTLTTGKLEALPALDRLLKSLEQQLEALKSIQIEIADPDNSSNTDT